MNILLVSNVLLWLVVLALSAVVLALVRQIGVLHERSAPAGALAINRKLKAGEAAPELVATSLEGRRLRIGGRRARATLLMFVAPDCPVCKAILPALRAAATSESRWLGVILASDGGEPGTHREFVRSQHLESFDYLLSRELGLAYGVSRLPYACLIDEGGRIAALGIINSREHLDSLFEARERRVGTLQEHLARS